MSKFKKSRSYDARGRLEQAQRNREIIIEAARRAFLERGYAATTINAVAPWKDLNNLM
jgi:AcrR family transcriptional regulator